MKSSVKNPIIASAPSPPYRLTLENFAAKKLSKFWDLKIQSFNVVGIRDNGDRADNSKPNDN